MSEHSSGGARKPVDYDELFPGRFLKAGLLNGRDVTLTIAQVDIEPLPQDDGKTRVRGVITFQKTDKQLVLNSTNGQCLRAMFGRKVQDWIGKRVTLRAELDNFGSKKVDAIRIAGSPDLAEPMTIEISMPRRKPRQRRLEVTGGGNGKRPPPKQERGAPYRAPEVQAEIDSADAEYREREPGED